MEIKLYCMLQVVQRFAETVSHGSCSCFSCRVKPEACCVMVAGDDG